MSRRIPVLLSFYGLSNGTNTMLLGQIGYTPVSDLSFREFSRRKTFRTLFTLYRTRPYGSQSITLFFQDRAITVTTNAYGAFYETQQPLIEAPLSRIVLDNGNEVKLMPELFDPEVRRVASDTIVVSDIDDTLLHSFITKKLRKFRTMAFTRMERRNAVLHMKELINGLVAKGASVMYLSNSEQNLYPLIYRFLRHNDFPDGPVFLKQLRSLWDLIRNVKMPLRGIHKSTTLQDLMTFFPDSKFVLMGDNTQQDLSIYMSVAEKQPENVSCIIVRRVVKRKDKTLISKAADKCRNLGIRFYYGEMFPEEITC